jgi:pSer/pThr/pTyr-binding forkhead associated (FHA) protein
MARLIVKTDEGTETVDLSVGTPAHIGRDESNEIPLPTSRGASRKHCRIAAVQSGGVVSWELTDLGATNKTRVNGKPADKCVLSSGDVIAVGSVELTFEDPDEEARLKEAGSKGVCYVEWVKGERKGEKIWLEGSRSTLGRRTSNTIPLDDRMSSGHHAEITKDLNGYTIRDLGSTNGTLVNGEPTTEATLTHGTRIRIGNSLLVFKDPSMKDIEVELSQFDEDEGWGMMGDIDLTRARGSYLGLFAGLLLVGAAAAGGWFLMQQAEEEAGGAAAVADANLVDAGDMEDKEAVDFLWAPVRDQDPVSARSGSGKLSVRHTGDETQKQSALVVYANELPARKSEPMRVRANLRASGDAALVVIWRNWRDLGTAEVAGEDGEEAAPAPAVAASGGTRVSHTVSLGSGRIDTVVAKPSWAHSMQIGVRVGPEGSATLDDVNVSPSAAAAIAAADIECPGDPDAYLNADGSLDLVNGLTVLLVGGAPVAQMGDGTWLEDFIAESAPDVAEAGAGAIKVEGYFLQGETKVPATVTWSQMGENEGLLATVDVPGAGRVGLATNLVRSHLDQGLNVLTTEKAGSISAASGQKVDGLRKTLGGEPHASGGRPSTLVTIAPAGDAAGNALELLDADDDMLLTLRHSSEGASAGFNVITNYEVQSRLALSALTAAKQAVETQPGRGIGMLREVALLFPFVKSAHDEAQARAQRAEVDARTELDEYAERLRDFQVFRSGDALERLDASAAKIRERYPDRGAANGPLEIRVAEIGAEAATARAEYYGEHAGAELARLERLAVLLSEVEGYEPMAAIFYRTIVDRFGHLEGDDPLGRRVVQAREKFEALMKQADVSAAVPVLPDAGN